MDTINLHETHLAMGIVNRFFGQTIEVPESLLPIINPVIKKAYKTAMDELKFIIKKNTTPAMLLDFICFKLGTTSDEIIGNRKHENSFAKHLYLFVGKYSLPSARYRELVKEVEVTHCMVTYARNKIQNMIDTKDKRFYDDIMLVLESLNIDLSKKTSSKPEKPEPSLAYYRPNSDKTVLSTSQLISVAG